MERREMTLVCAVMGVLCLCGGVACAMMLDLGGTADHIFVAAALVVLALAAVAVLRYEKTDWGAVLFLLLPIGAAL